MRKHQSGFTLIEIAIVLVIIGLLLGGVLKGQELITAARVRNLISTQDGVKAAYFGFLDRYRSLPGDYVAASTNIPGCAGLCLNGNNDGQISGVDEPQMAWEHMSKAGFITGSYTYPVLGAGPLPTNTPSNPYGSLTQLILDGVYRDLAADAGTPRHNLKTGNNIPSDILAEVDRKVDDGLANGGQFRHSVFGTIPPVYVASCATAANAWQSQTPVQNCGGASLF
jgi:prepilin-type N-terminal cleavage/methylation domain-containing protein